MSQLKHRRAATWIDTLSVSIVLAFGAIEILAHIVRAVKALF